MPDKNIETVRGLYRAFAARDFAVIQRLFDPAVVIVQSELLPWGGRHEGMAGLIAFMGALLEHIDSSLEIADIFDAGNRVIVSGRTRGTVRRNGAEFDLPFVHVWELREGRVVRFEPYIEIARMRAALQRT